MQDLNHATHWALLSGIVPLCRCIPPEDNSRPIRYGALPSSKSYLSTPRITRPELGRSPALLQPDNIDRSVQAWCYGFLAMLRQWLVGNVQVYAMSLKSCGRFISSFFLIISCLKCRNFQITQRYLFSMITKACVCIQRSAMLLCYYVLTTALLDPERSQSPGVIFKLSWAQRHIRNTYSIQRI